MTQPVTYPPQTLASGADRVAIDGFSKDDFGFSPSYLGIFRIFSRCFSSDVSCEILRRRKFFAGQFSCARAFVAIV
jgi:hypothetical protein